MKKNVFRILAAAAAMTVAMTACKEDGGKPTNPTDKPGTDTNGTVAVTGVTLSQTVALINVGDTLTLRATVQPNNATNKSITWAVTNPNVATVINGFVTALSVGSTTVVVTTVDGTKTAQCNVTVDCVTGVTLDRTTVTLDINTTQPLTATVQPSTATNKTATWSSSNPNIATVDNNGLVTTKTSAGTTTITATTQSGGKTATCTVTVDPSSSVGNIDYSVWNIDNQNPDTIKFTSTADAVKFANYNAPTGKKIIVLVSNGAQMQNVTDKVIEKMQTPATNKKPEEFVYNFKQNPVIQSVTLAELGDSTGTNQGFQILRASLAANPNMQITGSGESGRMKFVPIKDPVYQSSTYVGRSFYSLDFFTKYQRRVFDLFPSNSIAIDHETIVFIGSGLTIGMANNALVDAFIFNSIDNVTSLVNINKSSIKWATSTSKRVRGDGLGH